ncbi:MAG: hypothetical protein R3182_06945 [Draconibacterium sp.]|nr:hypothetical protein [Draconibacterium sp.]
MKKILEAIKVHLWRFWVSTWWVWAAVVLAVVAGLIFGWNVSIWVFFGGVISVIAFVWLRQIWWFVWGSEKGDYPGREGWFKKLVLLIFPKLRK